MRISLRLVAFLWLGLFLVIGGLLFSAYSQFKPESFVALIHEQVQKNYPGSKLQVGKVSYGFSLDFNLKLKDITLHRSERLIGQLGELELKVPWWLLLTNQGNAQINITRLDIYVEHEESGETGEPAPKNEKIPSEAVKVELPAYLVDAGFTVRAKEVSIKDINNSRRYFNVSKLLVRQFQYGKNSAFELNIPIEITHNEISYTSDLWLFGDVTPEPQLWKLNYRGEFRTKESSDKFQIEDIVIHGKSDFNPKALSVLSMVEFLIDKQKIGEGQLTASTDDLNVDLNLAKLPLSYFGFISAEIQNPFLKKLQGEAAGTISFKKSLITETAKLSGKLTFDGELLLAEGNVLPGKWQVGVENFRWDVSFISSQGEANYYRRSVVDSKTSKVAQYHEEIVFSSVDFNQVISTIKPLAYYLEDQVVPYYVTVISCKKCPLGDKIFDSNVKYGFSPDQKFYQASISGKDSHMNLNFSEKLGQKALDVIFNNFVWEPSYSFLNPFFGAIKGELTGSVEGRWSDDWDKGKWLARLDGKNIMGSFGRIPDLIAKTAEIFNLNSKQVSAINLDFAVQNNLLSLKSLLLESEESAKISGTLSPDQKSSLTLAYPKNKKIKPIKKEDISRYWVIKE